MNDKKIFVTIELYNETIEKYELLENKIGKCSICKNTEPCDSWSCVSGQCSVIHRCLNYRIQNPNIECPFGSEFEKNINQGRRGHCIKKYKREVLK